MSQLGSQVFWHEAIAGRVPGPAVEGSVRADVAIVGGGFTGLWTAYLLTEAAPGIEVVVLEAADVAFGASGRNGGFAMTLLDFSLHHLVRNHGDEPARAAHQAVARSVREIDATVAREGIDCDLEANGLLVVATNPAQVDRIEQDLAAADRLGLDGFRRLDRAHVREQLDSPLYLAGMLEDDCAIVNPAKLAVGLARVLEQRGVTLFETSPVTGVHGEPGRVVLTTPTGQVMADQVVLSTNAWMSRLPGFERRALPLYTYVVLTEPLSDTQWDAIGWSARQGVEDKRNYVHYYRPTADGRVLWGGTDAVHHLGGRVAPQLDRHEGIRRRLEREFLATFPQLGRVRFTHHWGGPISVTPRFVPSFGTLPGGRIHFGFGYAGHGVAPAHTGGRILRDFVLERSTEDTNLCFVDRPSPRYPPEPFAWAGGELTRRLLQRQDRQMDQGRSAGDTDPWLLRVLNQIAG